MKIESIKALAELWVHRFPTRPVKGLRIVRCAHVVVGVDELGTVYASMRCNSRVRQLSSLREREEPYILVALEALGMFSKKLKAERDAELSRQVERSQARDAVRYADELAKKYGIKVTSAKLTKLRRLAK